jgi:hypothetical protein
MVISNRALGYTNLLVGGFILGQITYEAANSGMTNPVLDFALLAFNICAAFYYLSGE